VRVRVSKTGVKDSPHVLPSCEGKLAVVQYKHHADSDVKKKPAADYAEKNGVTALVQDMHDGWVDGRCGACRGSDGAVPNVRQPKGGACAVWRGARHLPDTVVHQLQGVSSSGYDATGHIPPNEPTIHWVQHPRAKHKGGGTGCVRGTRSGFHSNHQATPRNLTDSSNSNSSSSNSSNNNARCT
jgi:hypothetical protein